MNVHCADCDHTFLLTPDGASVKAACPSCGGDRLERDQPSPTHSDGELRDMIDSGYDQDMGGNPLQEGVWGDGGWQPWGRRDESFASVRKRAFDMEWDFSDTGKQETHKFIVTKGGQVHSLPSGGDQVQHEDVADHHDLHGQNFPHGMSLGVLYDDNSVDFVQHDTPHSAQALESMLYGHFGVPTQVDPNLKPTTNEERFGLPGAGWNEAEEPWWEYMQRKRDKPAIHHRPNYYNNPLDKPGLIRGGSVDTLNMDPYLPWTHVAEALPDEQPAGPSHTFTAQPGRHGIHAGTVKWLQFLDASVEGLPARGSGTPIVQRHGMRNSPDFGRPVQIGVHHPLHEPIARHIVETSHEAPPSPELKAAAEAMLRGEIPLPPGVPPHAIKFGSTKTAIPAFLAPIVAPLVQAGGVAGVAQAALPKLMQGALFGAGSNMMGGFGGQPEEQEMVAPRGVEQLSHVTADVVTPHTNPGYHDTEDGDTKQFDDGSTSTNFDNPNVDAEAGGAATGEDNVDGGIGANQPNFSPGTMEKVEMLLPLLMHYFHSPESAANDPLLRELHEQLDREAPGYLDQAGDDDSAVHELFQKLREPTGVTASTKEANPMMGQPMAPGQPQGQQLLNPQQDPAQQSLCMFCGGPTMADGTCPQCGAKPQGQFGSTPGVGTHPVSTPVPAPGYTATPPMRSAANHQGPVTKEQQKAVAELLIASDRAEEIPIMLDEPWNYAEELAAVANRINTPEQIDPNDPANQPPPAPAQEIAPPGATMPVPNPADPSMMPMQAHVAAGFDPGFDHPEFGGGVPCPACGGTGKHRGTGGTHGVELCGVCLGRGKTRQESALDWQYHQPSVPHPLGVQGKVATPHNGAPRCPSCGSATTGFVKNEVGNSNGECHACGNVWDLPEASGAKVAAPVAENPIAVPAADQDAPRDVEREQDSSHTWQTDDGQQLQVGGEYEIHDSRFQIPDIVKVVAIKPDAIEVETIGEYQPAPGDDTTGEPLTYKHEITREEVETNALTFVPSNGDSNAGEQNLDEYADSAQAPTSTEAQPTHPVTDQHIGQTHQAINVDGTQHDCPRCGSPDTVDEHCLTCGFAIPYDGAQIQNAYPIEGVDEMRTPGAWPDLSGHPIRQGAAAEMPEVVQDADTRCPKCASEHISSTMSSPTTNFHECFRCGSGWETKEEDYMDPNTAGRDWIMNESGPGGDDFFAEMERHKAMRESGQGSRSLSAIAERDPRLQAIKERLEENASHREAGRKYTPREQREFIDEQGVARNADKLNLGGTHYEARAYVDRGYGRPADGSNVRDEDLFLGV